MTSSCFVFLAIFLLSTSTAAKAEESYENNSCEKPLSYSFSCSTETLCQSASTVPTTICFRLRSCLLGYCSTSDSQQIPTSDVCDLLGEYSSGQADDVCLDGFDSSFWMTDYYEAVDCDDSSVVYMDCTETLGDVSSSTVAALGFSAVGLAALAIGLLKKRRRRSTAVVEEQQQSIVTRWMKGASNQETTMEMTSSGFQRMA